MNYIRLRKRLFGLCFAAVAVCGLVILFGCRNPLELPDRAETSGGTGAVALTINGRSAAGRTIMPSLPGGIRFYLEFEALTAGNTSFSESWDGTSLIDLDAGDWDLTVTSYIPVADVRRFIARGTTRLEVKTGEVAEGDITLVPIEGGSGTFSWDIRFSSNITSAQMFVERIDGGAPAFSENFVLSVPAAAGSEDLPTGTYWVLFRLSGPGGSAEIGKVLHIHQNLESGFSDEDDLFENFAFPSELLDIILGAWNGLTWNFNFGGGRQITAGHFDLLGIDLDGANFDNIVYWFNYLTDDNNAPETDAALKYLVDAALIGIAGSEEAFVRATNLWTRSYAEGAIRTKVRNVDPDTFGFIWDGYTVTVTAGYFEVPVTFVPVPVEYVAIASVGSLEQTYSMLLSATVTPADARYRDIRWEIPDAAHGEFVELYSPNEAAGTVYVKGLEPGNAVLRAVSVRYPARYDVVTIHVFGLGYGIPIEGVTILTPNFTIESNGHRDLDIELTPDDTTQGELSAESSNTSVATVGPGPGGVIRVTGVFPGTAVITVRSVANPSRYDTVEVTVVATPTGVIVTPLSASVARNETLNLAATVQGPSGVSQGVIWTVQPVTYATIGNNGLLTLLPTATIGGTITVRAMTTHANAIYGEAAVTVLAPVPTGVTIDSHNNTMIRGGSAQTFTATIQPEGADLAVTWSVSPLLAGVTMTPAGVLTVGGTAVTDGTQLTVTVMAAMPGSGITPATAIITVRVPPEVITVTRPAATVTRGTASGAFTAVAGPIGAYQGVEWSVSPTTGGVSINSATGVLTVPAGAPLHNLTVTATTTFSGSAVSGTATITVVSPAPENVIVSPYTAILVRGDASETFTAGMSGIDGIDPRVIWSIEPPNAATITSFTDTTATVQVTAANTAVSPFSVIATAVGHDVYGTATVTVREVVDGPPGIVLPDFPPVGGGIDEIHIGRISLLATEFVEIEVPNPDGQFTSIRWFFGGEPITATSGANMNSHVPYLGAATLMLGPRIHGNLLPVGDLYLTVEVIYNGQPRSRRIAFEVRM